MPTPSLLRIPWIHQGWTRAITNSWSSPKLTSIESVMPSNHLVLCRPLPLPPLIFPSIRVFSNESALLIRWPKDWSFSFSISPSNEYSGVISFTTDWFDPWVGKISWRREQISSPVFLPGEFQGQRSLVGYSPWGCKE